jgi:hypothetical protein
LDVNVLARAAASTSHHSQSPNNANIEEIEDDGTHPQRNIPSKKTRIQVLESSEDDTNIGNTSSQPRKKVSTLAKEKFQTHCTGILESSEDDNNVSHASQPRKKVSRVGTKKKIQSPNIPPKTNHHILESSEDDDNQAPSRAQPQKKKKVSTKEKAHSTSQSKRSGNSRKNSDDSEIEIIEKPEESPEQELGMSIRVQN